MSSSSQFEKEFKRESTHTVPDRDGARLGEGSNRSQTCLEQNQNVDHLSRDSRSNDDAPFYKRPNIVLFNDRHWRYIQKRYHMTVELATVSMQESFR